MDTMDIGTVEKICQFVYELAEGILTYILRHLTRGQTQTDCKESAGRTHTTQNLPYAPRVLSVHPGARRGDVSMTTRGRDEKKLSFSASGRVGLCPLFLAPSKRDVSISKEVVVNNFSTRKEGDLMVLWKHLLATRYIHTQKKT